jgi:hypothetical protein
MFLIKEFVLLAETEKAVKARYVARQSMLSVDVWIPKRVCRLTDEGLQVQRWFLQDVERLPALW